MPCERVDFGQGVRSIVCGRSGGKTLRGAEEAAILADIRATSPKPSTSPPPPPAVGVPKEPQA